MNDPVWNTPEPTTIGGRSFVVRELPAGSLRAHLRDLVGILGNFSANAEAATSDQQGALALTLIDNYAEEMVSIMAESTSLTADELTHLPGSVFFELAGIVLKAQEPMVRAFFRLRQQAKGLLAPPASASSNGSFAAPSSSAPLSPPDSTSTPLPSA